PAAPSSATLNEANLTAPAPMSPADGSQLDTVRPTLRIRNATSSGAGARMYEFQIADNSSFTVVAGQTGTAVVAVSQAGIPEGPDGTTSYQVPVDLLPTTMYHWRARALQGASVGPWSSTSRFRTKIDSFKSGNQAFDILTNGRTVADSYRNLSYEFEGSANPGAKLNGHDSYLMYRITTLREGEISLIARRTKPDQNGVILSMQDGTGDFNSNAFRVRVEKPDASRVVLEMVSQNSGQTVEAGVGWEDHRPYFIRLEWRGGTARLRIHRGENAAAPVVAELSTSYTQPYSPANHVVLVGSLAGTTMKDVRYSRLYIGPGPRPID
ncbi:MAG TPA: hypothetical protein VNI83_00470, partial [Vicinamibacterales bacterium]|nr:hypothetical protein [Vicinamibacterales bacterium]